jgi:tetratricopeptide (TPR) repeat protein
LPVVAIAFLAGSFLYVWLRVEPLLEYHSYGPYFYRQQVFLETFLGRPGGVASYAGVFLAQLNYQNWLGALVFIVLQCAVFLTALFCLARVSGRAPGFVALAPPFVLLLLRNRYGGPVSEVAVGLLLALAASAAYLSVSWRRPWVATALSGLVSGILFVLAGLWSALGFGSLCGLYVMVQMRHWPAGLVCLVLALAAPLVAIGMGILGAAGLVGPLPEGVDGVLAAALYASVPIAGAFLVSRPKAAGTPPAAPQPGSQGTAMPAPEPDSRLQAARRGQVPVVVMFLLGWAAVWLSFDGRRKHLAAMDYHASRGEYAAVLESTRQVGVLDHPAKARLLLALYHTGRLPEELFSFHNLVDELPFERLGDDFRAQSQPLFELGLINDAEHTAHEAIELEGNHPDLLRLLARVNLLKDRPQAAQVFLNVLSLMPFQAQRASDAWPMGSPQLPVADLASLAALRTRMLTNDVLHDGLPAGRLLAVQFATNPTNRMVFEYLMAYNLLDLELKEAAEHLRFLDKFDYPRIPRSYEEALLLFQQAAGVRVEMRGRTIRPETVERFRQFRETLGKSLDGAGDQTALAAHFGDTYWYYYYVVRNRQLAAERQASGP